MNQKELINVLANKHGLPKDFAERILKTILNTIIQEVRKTNFVRLRNFGTFQAKRSHRKIRVKFDDSDNIFRYYG